jgi:AcrR family transcriptional regulator
MYLKKNNLNTRDSSQQWIEAGYLLFAEEGREGTKVEKMARLLGRNKSGFYHFFGDPDTFFYDMLEYHCIQADQLRRDIGRLHSFNPDFLKLMVRYRNTVLVQTNLSRSKDFVSREFYDKVNKRTDKEILPLWMNHIRVTRNPSLALQLWNMLREQFYARLNTLNLNVEYLEELVNEFSRIMENVRRLDFVMEQKKLAATY